LPPSERTVVLVSLGCGVRGFAPCHPAPDDPSTYLAGVMKRFASKSPDADPVLLQKLKSFVLKFCEENLKPLSCFADTSPQRWLDHTSYPQWRKAEFIDLLNKFPEISEKHFKVKGFMKDETYPSFKHARGINARHDRFKLEVGPIFKLMEEEVYKLPWFIKHVPVALRPAHIRDRLYALGRKYFATDYTAFEALFTKELMEACEFVLYEYMSRNLPGGARFMEIIREVLLGVNRISNKYFSMKLPATRMSGEMCTSLGNGFSNLMFMLFVAQESGIEVDGFVEGDDGIFAKLGEGELRVDLFPQLGLNIKLEEHTDLCAASFCGIVFDPEDCINLTDPRKVLLNIGWTSNRYLRSNLKTKQKLLRVKALSLHHQYPGCPVISSIAQYILRLTRGTDVRHFVRQQMHLNEYQREIMIKCLDTDVHDVKKPTVVSRLLMEKKFGMSVELQLSIENYFAQKTDLSELDIPCADLVFHADSARYWHEFQASAGNPMASRNIAAKCA
jgi:hypothetical protein